MNMPLRLLPAVRRWVAMLLLALLVHAPATAQRPPNVTDGELALLPVYCPDTQGFKYGDPVSNPSPRSRAWVERLGKAFWAVHHHCWGLIKVRRAMAPGVAPAARTGLIKGALSDYDYVIRHSDRSFPLLPDIYLKMGEANLLLGETANAAAAYEQARRLKPDFWPAYAGWAETLFKSGNRLGALAHLEEGMRNAPTAQALQQQYQRYGGDLKRFVAQLPPPPAAGAASAGSPTQAAPELPAPGSSAALKAQPSEAASAASAAASR